MSKVNTSYDEEVLVQLETRQCSKLNIDQCT